MRTWVSAASWSSLPYSIPSPSGDGPHTIIRRRFFFGNAAREPEEADSTTSSTTCSTRRSRLARHADRRRRPWLAISSCGGTRSTSTTATTFRPLSDPAVSTRENEKVSGAFPYRGASPPDFFGGRARGGGEWRGVAFLPANNRHSLSCEALSSMTPVSDVWAAIGQRGPIVTTRRILASAGSHLTTSGRGNRPGRSQPHHRTMRRRGVASRPLGR